ncbi:MAG: Mov34/MPN/PAD-1 family protein [Candidatus Xenobiia bacterium LiM19]
MYTWKNLESDLIIDDISVFFEQKAWMPAFLFIYHSFLEPRIYITQECHGHIVTHLNSDTRNELGGLLLGDIYRFPYSVEHNYPFFSVITNSIESLSFRNTSVSLHMGTELWIRAQEHTSKGKSVIGWYHSHPNLGAFFSCTDRATQKAFFNNPFSLGVVIDPVRFEVQSFVGPDSEKLQTEFIIVDGNILQEEKFHR